MQKNKTPMPAQCAEKRVQNFDEVSLGYTEEMAQNEAARCLNCPNRPCVSGCPVGVKIPDFIALIREKKYKEAYLKDRESSTLPAVCGRVCPQEMQCESQCVRGRMPDSEPVAIGRLERWIADWYIDNIKNEIHRPAKNGKKIAVVGSGPSGLSCANDLAVLGYEVIIFESQNVLGGVLAYGIPRFVLPRKIVEAEIDILSQLGVQIKTNTTIGKDITLGQLRESFDAVYVACGTGKSKNMNIEGEDARGVYLAGEYLYKINLSDFSEDDKVLKTAVRVIVVGGGNVAIDAARCARRIGAEVTIVYRRDKEQMPARHEEIANAEDEGIKFEMLSNPVKIITNEGAVAGIECVKMHLTDEVDARGKKTRPLEGSNYKLPCDLVIMALGYESDEVIKNSSPGLEINKNGLFIVNENLMTSLDGVFAGGDIVTGPLTVIKAMGMGREAAKHIDKFVRTK